LAVLAQGDLHPQLFSYLFIPLLLHLYLHRQGGWRQPLAGGIVLLWAFAHPSFPLGLLLLAAFACSSWLQRRRLPKRDWLAWFLALSIPALLLALLVPSIPKNVLAHSTATAMLANVKYWQPLWSTRPSCCYEMLAIAGLLAVVAFSLAEWWRSRRSGEPHRTLKLGVILLLTLLAARHLRFYPLIYTALLPLLLTRQLPRRLVAVHILSVGGLLLMGSAYFSAPFHHFGLEYDRRDLPVHEVDYLLQAQPPGRVFNSYNFGSYIIFRTKGALPVFIDPRSSQLYPDAFFSDFLAAYQKPAVFERLVNQYGIRYTLLKQDSPVTQALVRYLDRSSHWQRAFTGEVAAVHRRLQATDGLQSPGNPIE
jgi:hypothetical protein